MLEKEISDNVWERQGEKIKLPACAHSYLYIFRATRAQDVRTL